MNYFKTQYNADNFEHSREVFTMESLTQPDQVMSIDDMLARHEGGLPVQGPKSPHLFHNVPEDLGYVPDVKSLDLSEIQDLRNELSYRVRELKREAKQAEETSKEGEKVKTPLVDDKEPPAPEKDASFQDDPSQQNV